MYMPSPPASFIHIHAPCIHLYTYRCLHPFIHIHSPASIYTRTWPSVSIYIHNFPLHPFIHGHGPCIHLYMYMAPASFIHVHAPEFIYTCTWPLHPFIHVHASASVYTCTCHCTHLYTYMPLHLFIHICATVPIYTHTWHCIHLYTYMPLHLFIHIHAPAPVYTHTCPCTYLYTHMPLSFDTFYFLSHPSGFISIPPSELLLLKCNHLMILASSLCISITPCMLALVFIWLFNQSLPPCKITPVRTDTALRIA